MFFVTNGVSYVGFPLASPLQQPPYPLSNTHLEAIQRRADVCPHLVPLDNVSAVLGVPTRGPGACALVVALVDVLGGEPQSAIAQGLEHAGGLHFKRSTDS